MKLKSRHRNQILGFVAFTSVAVLFFNWTSTDTVNEVISANVGVLKGHDTGSSKPCRLEIAKNPDFNQNAYNSSPIEFYLVSQTLDPDVRIAVYGENNRPEKSKWQSDSRDQTVRYLSEAAEGKSRKIVLHFEKHSRRIVSAELMYATGPLNQALSESCVF